MKLQLSENSQMLVKMAFTTPISNAERQKIRASYQHSGLQQTHCPKLDPIFKTASGKSDTKSNDTELSRLQAFVLDQVGPLLHPQSMLESEGEVSLEDAAKDVQDALRPLGNALAQMSTVRRKHILKALNPDIQDLASEEAHFQEAAPKLFRSGFEKAMKEWAESIKIVAKSSGSQSTRTQGQPKKFFSKGCSTAPKEEAASSINTSTSMWPHNISRWKGSGFAKKRQLDDENRSEVCLLHHPYPQR